MTDIEIIKWLLVGALFSTMLARWGWLEVWRLRRELKRANTKIEALEASRSYWVGAHQRRLDERMEGED